MILALGWPCWNGEVEELLAPLLAGQPGGIEALASRVRQGQSTLLAVAAWPENAPPRVVGYLTWRRDLMPGGVCDLVIEYAAGHLPGVDLVAALVPELERQARRMGCDRLRIHTARRGLALALVGQGFATPEFVCVKEL